MNCYNRTQVLEPPYQLFSLIIYIPLITLGITCNVLAIWVFCFKLKKWTETTVFMMNLVISDIMVIFTFPFRLYAYLHLWDLGSGLCKTLQSCYFANMYMSIFTITAIAFDRYLAIRHPLKYKCWASLVKASVICCVLWISVITVSVLRVLQSNDLILSTCFQKVSTYPFNLAPIFVLVGFSFPLIIISFCSVKIIMTLCDKEKLDPYQQHSTSKAVRIVISNLVVFVVCFMPIHVGYTIRFVAESFKASCYTLTIVNSFIHVATAIANCNCVLDSLCYYFAASEFREALSRHKFI
ncbi:G-protein coupled receptor 35 [Pseudophryne corroboree]|uniref:G-protein coupled receptor 35 n=1 Tax=Pseudophryne corroboree TaxID=495146 RepID=UPI0030821AE8